MSSTTPSHDEGQLITKIRTKWRLLTPTKEKFWQSLLLGRLAQPVKGTLAQRWGTYKDPPSLEGQVLNSLLTFTLVLVHSSDLSIERLQVQLSLRWWNAALHQRYCSMVKNLPVHYPFWSQVRSVMIMLCYYIFSMYVVVVITIKLYGHLLCFFLFGSERLKRGYYNLFFPIYDRKWFWSKNGTYTCV
jgi:hypothetical protein